MKATLCFDLADPDDAHKFKLIAAGNGDKATLALSEILDIMRSYDKYGGLADEVELKDNEQLGLVVSHLRQRIINIVNMNEVEDV